MGAQVASGGFDGRALPRRPPPPGVTAVAEALEERLDDLVDTTLEVITREVPVYQARGASVAADTRRAAAYVYASFIETLRTGSAPNAAVAGSLANVGADRAVQGIPLGDLLHAFRISARVAAELLTSLVVEKDLDRDAAVWVAEALVIWVDVVSNLAASSYSRTQVKMLHEQEERVRGFLLDLLYGAVAGEEALDRAHEVGWDPATTYWVAVFGDPTGDCTREHAEAFADALDRSLPVRTRGVLVVLVPATTATDVAGIEATALAVASRYGLVCGVGAPRSGVAGVRRSYLEAAEAESVAVAMDEPVVHHEDAVLDRLLRRDPELLDELVGRTIGPIEDYDRARNTDLVRTLETYFREGESPSRTAAALHTHAQTVRYRLGRIRDITGLAPDSEGRLHLMLGLRGRRLLRHGPPRPDGPPTG